MSQDFVYLASGSPRRRTLLQQIGVSFRVVEAAVDEAVMPGEAPESYVARLARAKADAGWERSRSADVPVLAADTAVVLDGGILGKPAHREEAVQMLRRLSGRTHQVLTAVTLRTVDGHEARLSRSDVTFRILRDAEAQAYWETGEPQDKAGAYAIQGCAAVFVEALRGSYSGVMGLPLFETAALLSSAGVSLWMDPQSKAAESQRTAGAPRSTIDGAGDAS